MSEKGSKIESQEEFNNQEIQPQINERSILDIEDIEKNPLEKFEPAPEGWFTRGGLADKLDRYDETIGKIAEAFRKDHSEYFAKYLDKVGKLREHYSPELVHVITEQLNKIENAPEGWKTAGYLRKKLSKADDTIKGVAETFREAHPEWFKKFLTDTGGHFTEHYSPELVESIVEVVAQ